MNHKFTYDNYTLTADFKNDFALTLTASDLYSGDSFLNEHVELTKIKKDTIIAALTRKNEKNLKCHFSIVDVEPKKLIIAFEVAFDYLPTFSEYISLEQIDRKGNGINKVESAELKSDLEQLEQMINNISNKNSIIVTENSGVAQSFTGKGEIYTQDVERGNYLLEITGYFTCTAAALSKHDLAFLIETGEDSLSVDTTIHTNSSYGYPFAVRKEISLSQNNKLKVTVSHKQNQAFSINNTIFSLCPMVRLK